MNFLTILQTIIAVLLIVVILLQQKGAGAGSMFGGGSGGSDSGNVFSTKRGIEKTLHRATIILALVFLGLALTNLML